jgi:protein Tex
VQVTVLEVDLPRKRIALSMKSRPEIGSASSGSRTNDRGKMSEERSTTRTNTAKPTQLGGDWFTQALNKKR